MPVVGHHPPPAFHQGGGPANPYPGQATPHFGPHGDAPGYPGGPRGGPYHPNGNGAAVPLPQMSFQPQPQPQPMTMHDQAEAARLAQDYEALVSIIKQWNANRLDLFALTLPNEVGDEISINCFWKSLCQGYLSRKTFERMIREIFEEICGNLKDFFHGNSRNQNFIMKIDIERPTYSKLYFSGMFITHILATSRIGLS